jgi:cytochrome c556
MMKYSLAAVALAIGMTSAAFAGPADDAVKARQECMKANGAAMGVFVPMVKAEKPYDNAMVQEAVGKIEAACGGWAGWWKPEFKKGETLESWAKDEIWTDTAGWTAAESAYGPALAALKASADEASFKTAFGGFGATCKGCHEKFRRPKE